ncbi:MAG: hypothetical protein M3542_11560 [Acidobacteriota bacterium]|nr:hypothetical protein [Acidobacteriota bacterium]MDQ5871151.1 hypothetical protein [Acidobacteriota bacterium]
MDAAARASIAEYVKPLALGLDGITYYGDVERVLAATERIADGRTDVDRDLLYLLAVFSGQEKWVSRFGHKSRTEIFLKSQGVEPRVLARLWRGLGRLELEPATAEEEIVHDAVRLEELGAYGIARRLVEGYRERMDFTEMADSIEEAASSPLRTEAGRALAAPRIAAMKEFAGRLREEYREFSRDG